MRILYGLGYYICLMILVSGCKMPNKEEVVFSDFSGGWDNRQFPPTHVQKRVLPGKIPHILGVTVRDDGSLRWLRNQYAIDGPGGVTPVALFEYTTSSKEQLLVFGTDGKLHSLETDWSAATPSQFEYGYELFNGGGWTERAVGQQTAGPWGLVQHRDNVFVSHRSQATKYYEGTTALSEVGFKPPQSPFSATEDFTTWTEVDAGAKLTVAATRITAADLPEQQVAYVYKDFTDNYFVGDYTFQWNFQVADGNTDASFIMVGMADNVASPQGWGPPCWFCGVTVAAGPLYHLFAYGATGYVVDTVNLTASTTYYARVEFRTGADPKLSVYSDATYTTLVTSVEAPQLGDRYQYLYAGSAYGAGGSAATMDGYVDTLSADKPGITAGAGGSMVAGTYSYKMTFGNSVFESMLSHPVDIVVTADQEVTFAGLALGPTGTTWRRLYRSYTSSIDVGIRGTTYSLLVEIPDNTTTSIVDDRLQSALGDPHSFDHARPPKGDILVSHKDHLFMAGVSATSDSYTEVTTTDLQNLLYYSRLDEPYYWPGDNYIQVGDDSAIVALVSFRDYLMIFKTNSVWMLAGAEGSFVLRQVDSQVGATDPCSAVASPQGVAWTAPTGLAFYDGQSLQMLYKADSESPFAMPTSDYPWLAWHDGYLHFMPSGTTATRLLRWDSRRDVWEMHYCTKTADIVGIRAFNYGQYQSHILAYLDVLASTQKILVLHPAKAFANFDVEGTTWTPYFSRVRITLPPIVAAPGREIWIQDIRVDASWAEASLVVSGAGTAACNGTYNQVGIKNTKPIYKHTGSDYWIWYTLAGFWYLIDAPAFNGHIVYYHNNSADVTSGWLVDVGTPAPTVAEGVLASLHLYVNESADYSTGDLGAAPQGGFGVLLPPSYTAARQYIQIAGDYAEDFELRQVKVNVSTRKKAIE